MVFLSLFFVLFVHIRLFSKRGLLDPVSVFFIAFVYYSYLTPIAMTIFGEFEISSIGSTAAVTVAEMNKASLIYALGYLAYASIYAFLTNKFSETTYATRDQGISVIFSDYYSRIILIFILIGFSAIYIFFRAEFQAATESYESKIFNNYSSSSYSFVMNSILTTMSLLVNYTILNVRRHVLVTALAVAGFALISILTFSKAPLIYAALGVFCSLARFRSISFAALLSALVAAAILGTVFFIPAFSAYRATGAFVLQSTDAQTLGQTLSEASGPYSIMHLVLNGYASADGHPLWHSFVLWVPRDLWHNRPTDLAEGFAQQVMVGWKEGYGLGFSPFAEGYLRYGTIGSIGFMGLVGAVTAGLQAIFARMVPMAMRIPATLTIGGIVSVFVLRGVFSGLITQSLQNWLPMVGISLVATELARRIGASNAPARPAQT